MESAVPHDVWRSEENRMLIRNEIRNIINNQNEDRQIIDVVNSVIKKTRENDEVWSDEAEMIFKSELKNSIITQVGKIKFEGFTEVRKDRILNESFSLLKRQMQKKLGKGEFAKVERIDDRVAQFLSDNFDR